MTLPEQLKHTCDQIKKNRPSYQPILDFYYQVFLAQEQSKQHISLPAVVIEPDLLKIKQKNEMPLIDPSEFLIDLKQAALSFEKICELACDLAPKLSSSARILKKAYIEKTLDLNALYSAILNNQNSFLNDLAGHLNVPEPELVFFGYVSMTPSIQVCAEQLAAYLIGMPGLEKGYCPICGNHPDMAFLDQDGRRHLKCAFCSHKWRVKRMGCTFCDNNDKDMQHYFFSDEEKEYRVALCDNCHHYIKMVDLRQMDREFYPNLELISTLHLDMKAREKGYNNGESITNEVSH